jgi:undecaprenyl-diphosphatase
MLKSSRLWLVGPPIIMFAALAGGMLAWGTFFFDEPVLRWLHMMSSPALDTVAVAVTNTGDSLVVLGLAAAAAIALAYWRRSWQAALLFVAVAGADVINVTLKLLFERARPELWQQAISEHGFSFPSGHAMASSALVFALAIILWRTKWRWLAVGLGGAFMLAIGLTRLYLGVHYPSDVLAGWCVSLAVVFAAHAMVLRFVR